MLAIIIGAVCGLTCFVLGVAVGHALAEEEIQEARKEIGAEPSGDDTERR
ncbi:hypothetical protein [uncultured Ruminococcus sp.]|nr:hypothetical protein [uncultured Ruminococcus sp.]